MSLYMTQLLDQNEVTADFLTSKFIMAECFVMGFVMEFNSNLICMLKLSLSLDFKRPFE